MSTLRRRLVTLLAALSLPLLGPVGPARAEVLSKHHVQGAVVRGESFDYSDPCVEKSVYFWATRERVHYSASALNQCTGTYEYSVYGFGEPTTFRVTHHLSSATVTATIPLQDREGAFTGESVHLEETFTATGPAEFSRTTWHRRDEATLFTGHDVGIHRQARATGTVTLDQAFIEHLNYGWVVVQRP